MSLVKDSLIHKMDWKKLNKVENVKELYEFLIDFWVKETPLKEKL